MYQDELASLGVNYSNSPDLGRRNALATSSTDHRHPMSKSPSFSKLFEHGFNNSGEWIRPPTGKSNYFIPKYR